MDHLDDIIDFDTALQDAIESADMYDDGIDLAAEDYMAGRRQARVATRFTGFDQHA